MFRGAITSGMRCDSPPGPLIPPITRVRIFDVANDQGISECALMTLVSRPIPIIRVLLFAMFVSACPLRADEAPSASETFEQRILPIFDSPRPSSCTECHLSAVELKDYIR